MAKYQRISPKFWQDPGVRRWNDRQKLLALYLMSCPHRTSEGLFWLPRGYMAQDLGWGIDTVSKVLRSLIDTGFVAYDDATETLLILKALKYEAPAGQKQVPGAINRLCDVPPSPLFSQLREAAEQYAPEFAEALDEAFERGDLKHHRYPIDTVSEGYPGFSPSSSSSSSSSTSGSSRARATPLPDDWQPNTSHQALAAELGVDVADQADRLRDWAKAKGEIGKDWDARFRNWLRKAAELGQQPRASPNGMPVRLTAAEQRRQRQDAEIAAALAEQPD